MSVTERPTPRTSRLDAAAARRSEGGHGALGYGLVALAVGIALAIYFLGAEEVAARGTWFVIGETIGIAAAVLLAIAAILASRVRPLEWLFGDMTRVYVAHGVIGLIMFALVTLHPLLYVLGTLPETRSAAGVIVPFHLVALDWVSWLLIAASMVPTLFMSVRFDRWRWTHLLLGGAVILVGVSLLLTSTSFDTFSVPALRAYLAVLYVLALVAVIYVAVVRRIAEPKHEYRIAHAERHADANAVELHLEPVGRPLGFEAGQFAYFDLMDDRVQVKRDYESHPFSIASHPDEDGLRVIVGSGGEHTSRIQEIAASDEAHALVHGAYGRLGAAHGPAHKQLWIGGGIGVTPFLSLAEERSRTRDRQVTFVVAVERAEDAFYMDRLRRCEERDPGFRVVLWSSAERGRHPTAEAIAAEVPDLRDHVVLISGPEAMISGLSHELRRAGVRRDRIHAELAIGPPRRWRYASPGLRVMRALVAVELAVFVGAVIVSVLGRALT